MRIAVRTLVYCLLGACATYAECSLYVAPTGSDANAGTATAPFLTPNRAVEAAQPGATVCLHGGSYQLSSFVAVAKPLTLMSVPGEWAVISADNSRRSTVWNVIEVGASSVTVQNLEIVGGAYYGIKASSDLLGVPPSNVTIRDSKIHDTGRDAIKAYQVDGLLIEGNEVYNTGVRDGSNAEGIDIMASIPTATDSNGWGAIVRDNYIHNTATYGVYMKAGTVRGLIERNRIDQTGGAGIGLGQDSGQEFMRNGASYECLDCMAINNVVSNTQYAGLFCMAGWNVRFENNTVINGAIFGQAALFSGPNHNGLGCGQAVYLNNAASVTSRRPLVHMVQPSGPLTFDYNAYYSADGTTRFWYEGPMGNYYWNSLQYWQNGLGQDMNSFVAAFQVDADGKPMSGSPLIDRGVAISDILTDIAGTARPQGAGYEIGAYELPVSEPPVAAPTLTTLDDVTLPPSRKPQKVTLTAHVTSAVGIVNQGVVRFAIDGAAVGTASVSSGTATLAYTMKRSVAGTSYAVQAFYEGSDSFSASSSNVATLTIVP